MMGLVVDLILNLVLKIGLILNRFKNRSCIFHLQSMGWVIFLMAYFMGYHAHGQYITGPVAQGVGGAGRAGTGLAESVFLNPASLAHAPQLSTSMYYLDGDIKPGYHESFLGLTVADNHQGVVFPGAVSYIQGRKSFLGLPDVNEKMWQISLGNFIYKQLAFGVSLYRLSQKERGGGQYEQWNGTMGLHWNPWSNFALGLVFHHIVRPGERIPRHLQLKPAWGGGITYVASKFLRFKLDATLPKELNSKNRLTYHGGIESSVSKYVTFRLGGEVDQLTERNSYTLGMTFNLVRWRLDYSLKKYDEGTNSTIIHGVDLRVPI